MERHQQTASRQEPFMPDGAQCVRALGHRAYVGGMWEEIGQLQFDFLRGQGLEPQHCLLDIACGALRGGRHFISYLQPGNYLGLDKEALLIEMGVERELGWAVCNIKKPEFVVSDCFAFEKFSRKPDFSMAQSLFTHLDSAGIRLCLEKLRKQVSAGHVFYATFRHGDSADNPAVSHSLDAFRYSREEMECFGRETGWAASFIGDWGHPREQLMMKYEVLPGM